MQSNIERRAVRALTAFVLGAALAPALSAQTVTVTTGLDTVDVDWTSAVIADLPGPDGKVSLAEALIVTNHEPGHQTIEFAIPQSEWQLSFLYPGRAVVNVTNGFFMSSNDSVTIDARTQTAFTGDTNPDGWEVLIHGSELRINGANSTVLGLDGSSLSVTGAGCTVEGLTGNGNLTLFAGGGSLVEGCRFSTVKIDRSDDNVVVGNVVQRVRVLGFGASQLATGNRIGGTLPGERNVIRGYGSYNSEGLPSGSAVQLFDTSGTQVVGNWIGVDETGLAQGNTACIMGIEFASRNDGTVVRDNLIAGIKGKGTGPHHAGQLFGWAIILAGTGTDLEIAGNTIGLDANGDPLLGSVWGVSVGDAVTHPASYTDVTIGGTAPGDGNVIAGHSFNGVTVGRNVPQVRLVGNAIHSNGWLAVDLLAQTSPSYGVSSNDLLDADTGGNGVQNFPELRTVTDLGGQVRFEGRLFSAPSSTYTLEFFATSTPDPSGYGEAEVFVGRTTVVTDAAGRVGFDVLVPGAIPVGWEACATATLEPLGATSELSETVPVVHTHCQPDIGYGGPGTAELTVCGDVLTLGGVADVAVAGVGPGLPVYVLASTVSTPTPIAGGTIAAYPPQYLFGFVADGAGEVHAPIAGGAPFPLDLYVQAVYADLALPDFLGITNAVRVELLP